MHETFQSAPAGRRVIASMAIVGVALLVSLSVDIWMFAVAHLPAGAPANVRLFAVAVPVIVVAVAGAAYLAERSRISQFRIEDGALVLGRKRFSLAGLSSVGKDPAILKGAIRIWGNSGLGSIRGWFWSRRIGRFYAFLTDPERAVVLRWPERVVAVSPSDTDFLIATVGRAAGLPKIPLERRSGNG